MNNYERNMGVIRRRWPDVAKVLDYTMVEGCEWKTGKDKEGCVVFQGRQMTSCYSRVNEAKIAIETLPMGSPEPQWCFGVGCGELPRALLKRNKKTVVVLLNAKVTKTSLDSVYQADWLEHAKASLVLPASITNTLNVPQNAPFAVVPMELRWSDREAHPIRDMVFGAINSRFNIGIQYQAQLENDKAHWAENKQYMMVDEPVTALFDMKPRGRFIVVASGPSLDGELEWLRANREGATVIAVNSSLPVLIKAGIVPDICSILDSANIVARCMDGLVLPNPNPVALVYEPVVTPSIVSVWPGKRYYSLGDKVKHQGTVTHAAVDLAVKMGAGSITLLGADFCHPQLKSHAGDAPGPYQVAEVPAAMMPTFNGRGEETHTTANLSMYHRYLERYIKDTVGVEWYRRGRDGVPVRGTTWLE